MYVWHYNEKLSYAIINIDLHINVLKIWFRIFIDWFH